MFVSHCYCQWLEPRDILFGQIIRLVQFRKARLFLDAYAVTAFDSVPTMGFDVRSGNMSGYEWWWWLLTACDMPCCSLLPRSSAVQVGLPLAEIGGAIRWQERWDRFTSAIEHEELLGRSGLMARKLGRCLVTNGHRIC